MIENQPIAKPLARQISIFPLDQARLARAKAGFTTRRVPTTAMQTLVTGAIRPRSGDLVLARIDRVRHQTRVELPNGRKAAIHVGDEVLLAYADRYATDQFEAHVPPNLGPTQMVATGGVASRVLSRSATVASATEITPLGLVGNAEGLPINVEQFALLPVAPAAERPRTVCVIGTSMNSGKTTTIRSLANGLAKAGYKPGCTKVTGTGSGGDYWVMIDAGAHKMLDFTDVGLASTYRIPIAVIERKMAELIDHLAAAQCGVVLVEIADGLFQQETAALIASDVFKEKIDSVIFAAGDSMGASLGVSTLRSMDLPVVGVSGLLTASPLAAREAAASIKLPVYTRDDLRDSQAAPVIAGLTATLGDSLIGTLDRRAWADRNENVTEFPTVLLGEQSDVVRILYDTK